MLPDLTVLVAVLLGLMALGPGPAETPQAVLGTLLAVVVGGALIRMSLRRGLRALEDGDLLVAQVAARWTMTWPLLGWGGCLLFFRWGSWVHDAVPRLAWMASFVVLFLPGAVLFAMGWAARARIEAGSVSRRGGIPLPAGAGAAVRRGLRRNALVLLPLFVVYGLTEGMWVAGQLGVEPLRRASLWREAMPLLDIGAMMLLVVLALPLIPVIFAKALRAQPMDAGPLRERLERTAKAIDLRYRDIMIWRTGGRVFNAMVVGFTKRTRLIFLTDGLLNAMPNEEVLAVFCHEAGHAKRWHLQLFLVSFFSLSLLFYASGSWLARIGVAPELQIVLHLVVIWFVLLGWVSRRFERESDVYGADHAADVEPEAGPIPVPGLPAPLPRGAVMMMGALERIRAVVGHSGSHRHGSVEDRVSYIAAHATDPDTRAQFSRTRRSILLGITALVILAAGATVLRLPTELAQAQAYVASEDAMAAYREAWHLARARDAEDVARAAVQWQEAYRRFTSSAERLAVFSDPASLAYTAQSRFNAADTALHGLRDHAKARRDFAAVLTQLERDELPGGLDAVLRFQTHVALGRLSAWHYAELPAVHPRRDLAEALGHLEKAREVRLASIGNNPQFTPDERDYFDERLRLLAATIEAARGEHAIARRALDKLVQLGGPSPTWARRDLVELAEDARLELERLDSAR